MWKVSNSYFILFILLLLTSCHKEEPPMHTLKINFQEGDLPSLHPHALMIYLRGISLSKHLFEGLTRIDEQGKAKLAGAQSVEISPDFLHYIFHLRENRWSDGTLVTAIQYEKSWKEALSPTAASPRADLLYMIKNAEEAKKGTLSVDAIKVKAIDDRTLTVELAYPSPFFLELLAQPICAPLINPQVKEPTQFNGPFLVKEWKHGDSLTLQPNPYYWDQKQINLKQMDIYMIQDLMSSFALFEKNQIDWIGVPFVPLSAEMIQELDQEKKLYTHPVDRAFWLFLNTEHPSLSSSAIRQALSLAIDRQAITQHIFIGGLPLEKPLPTGLLNLSQSHPLKLDLAEAKQKFEKGLVDLKLTKETFPPLVITYSQQAGRKQLAEYLQQAWSQAFGIVVKIEPQEWNLLRVNLGRGQFQISGAFEAAFYNDPLELLEKFASLSTNNFPQWENSAFTALIHQAKIETNLEKRKELLGKSEQLLMQEMPFIPISSDNFIFSHNPALTGYIFDCVGACDFSRAKLN